MSNCYFFEANKDDQAYLSLTLSDKAEITAPLQKRTLAELKDCQQEAKLWLVLPVTAVSLLTVELPWLSESKARAAIPFALEEKLSQSVDALHFAFDKKYYHNHHYLVAVISKQDIAERLSRFEAEGLQLSGITLDWCALKEGESCLSDYGLLVNRTDFQGGLLSPIMENYRLLHPEFDFYQFSDSLKLDDQISPHQIQEPFALWVARRLATQSKLNLIQGQFKTDNQEAKVKRGLLVCGILAGIWLLTILLVNGIKVHRLNQQIKATDTQIATLYKKFFPDAKQVISPKFRISRLLQGKSGSEDKFFIIMTHLSKAMLGSKIKIEQIRFQNNQFIVAVVAGDFAQLENLQNQLKKKALQVKQTQASTQDKQVSATLELQ